MSDRRLYGAGAALALAAAAFLLWATRGQTLFGDEWGFFARAGGFHPSRMLEPDQGNLVLSTVLLYKLALGIGGDGNHLVLRIVWVGLDLLAAGVLFVWLRERVGGLLALVPALLFTVFGIAWEFFGSSLGIPAFLCVASGLAALYLLDHSTGTAEDAVGCLLLAISLSALSTGLAFLAGAAAIVLLEPTWRRRIWVVAVPLALYAAWIIWARKFHQTELTLEALAAAPASVVESLASVSASLFGAFRTPVSSEGKLVVSVNDGPGFALGTLLVVAAAWRIANRGFDRRLIVPLVMLLVYWGSIGAVSPPRDPVSGRYQYAGAIFVVLLLAELWRGYRPSRGVAVAVVAVGIVAALPNVANVGYAGDFIREVGERDEVKAAVTDLFRGKVDDGAAVNPPPFGVSEDIAIGAGDYFAATESFGSPGDSVNLEDLDPVEQMTADRQFLWLEGVVPEPIQSLAESSGCFRVTAGVLSGSPGFPAARGFEFQSIDGAPVKVGLRRYAAGYYEFEPSPGPGPYRVKVGPAPGGPPWTAALESTSPVRVCPLAAGG